MTTFQQIFLGILILVIFFGVGIDNINKITGENLLGIRVIRAFNAEEFQTNRFEKVNNDVKKFYKNK